MSRRTRTILGATLVAIFTLALLVSGVFTDTTVPDRRPLATVATTASAAPDAPPADRTSAPGSSG